MRRDGDKSAHVAEIEQRLREWVDRLGLHLPEVKSLGAIAGALWSIGDFRGDSVYAEAVEAAVRIDDEDEVTTPETYQDNALSYLTKNAARLERFGLAESSARRISNIHGRLDALRFICLRLLIAGEKRGRELLDEITTLRQDMSVIRGEVPDVVNRMVRSLERIGQLDTAWKLACSKWMGDPYQQADAFVAVAVGLAHGGRWAESRVAFGEAKAALDRDQTQNRHGAEWRLARGLARAGWIEQAEEMAGHDAGGAISQALAMQGRFEEAEQRAREINGENNRIDALLDIAAVAAAVKPECAIRLYTECASKSRKAYVGYKRPESLALIAIVLRKWRDAEESADRMDAPRRRDGVLQELAVALAEAGSVMEAERIARRVQTENDKANALAEIAVVLVKQGNVRIPRDCSMKLAPRAWPTYARSICGREATSRPLISWRIRSRILICVVNRHRFQLPCSRWARKFGKASSGCNCSNS
jgi:tetratricopeptide (TPR) repeat protein